MNPFRDRPRAGLAVVAAACLAGPALAHEGEMHIARSAAGMLRITDFDFAEPVELPPAAAPLSGWAGEDPIFVSIAGDDPSADLYALDPAAKISVEVVLFAPGVKLWNHDLSLSVSEPGQQLGLGPLPFGEHTPWNLDSSDPAFDPSAGEWTATFRLIDAGATGYLPSADYTLRLTVPGPGAVSLLAGAGLLARRRR